MLTFEQIKELIELVAKNRMSGLEVERSGFRLRVDGYGAAPVVAAAAPAVAAAPPALLQEPSAATPAAAPEPEEAAEDDESDAHVITSPIVGTFYAAPSPDADSFVQVGQQVKTGEVVCIIEAMKLMNEIESDVDGTVRKVLVKNGQPVEYGEPLFLVDAG